MDTTETTMDGSIETAVESIIAPIEEEKVETVEAETQATEEAIEEVEETAEVEIEATEDSDSDNPEDEEVSLEAGEQDEDDNTLEDAVQEEPDLIAVKVNGKLEQVSLDELKQGYSGQKYVQDGMQEAARQRKEAEQVYESLLSERQQISDIFQKLNDGGIANPPIEPPKELLESDPIGYMQDKLKYDEQLGAYNNQMAELQQVAMQQGEAEKQAKQVYLKNQMQRLQEVIPEFADTDKAGKLKERLVQGGQEHYGYSTQEIGQVMDARAIQVLNDALKYQAILSGKEKAIVKAKRSKPSLKPGAKKMSDSQVNIRKRQQAKLKKSGSVEDALGLILNT